MKLHVGYSAVNEEQLEPMSKFAKGQNVMCYFATRIQFLTK